MHVVYSFPHPVGGPGIGTTARHQVEGLVRAGVHVTLFCTSVEGALDPRVRVIRSLSAAGVRIPHRALGVQRSYQWHDRFTATWLSRLSGIDLVHVWPAACLQTLRAAARSGIPTVREVPNTHTGHAFETVAGEYARLGMPPLAGHSHTGSVAALEREELEYRRATALLVPSQFSEQTFVDRGFAEDRLLMHQYGYDPVAFPAPGAHARREPHSGLRALFMGRCEPRKGLHYALRAWVESGAARSGRLVVCGSFVEGYAARLAPLLSHPSVEVRAFTADAGRTMRDSDLLLLPSVEEGSALVTYEAQASGCVPVVSDAAGARVVHGEHGLVHAARDVAELTGQLRRLDGDPELLERLRRGALTHRQDLTWDVAAEGLRSAYEQVAGLPAVSVPS